MKGRKPTPTPILKARGSRVAARRTSEPKPPNEAPSPPKELGKAARAEWRRIVPLLQQMKLMAKVDRAALALYCNAFARWQDAEQNLAADGTVVKSPSGYPIQNPYLAISNAAAAMLIKLSTEFGFSPSARTRIHSPTGQTERVKPAVAEVPQLRIAE